MPSRAGLRKLLRYLSIYGPGRSLYKAAARLRWSVPSWELGSRITDVGMVGCGQFAFATIGYFLQTATRHRILACFDTAAVARDSMARALRVRHASDTADALLASPGLKTVYIASNHASHTPYAVQALGRHLDVYVEKPIAVSYSQLVELERARRASRGRLFAGYNRPFSAAVASLRSRIRVLPTGGFTMQCFVAGHRLGPEHWYRRPTEGTRICGNIGHWLDLMVHVLSWRSLPDRLHISMAWADSSEPDDNLSIAITSDLGDLFSVMLTSRCEPFEGINESIHIQHHETTCKIDDFRSMTIWQGERVSRERFWPKDVGHRRAILQPFDNAPGRDWSEVVHSTLLMLHIADMVRNGRRQSAFSFTASATRLAGEIGAS